MEKTFASCEFQLNQANPEFAESKGSVSQDLWGV